MVALIVLMMVLAVAGATLLLAGGWRELEEPPPPWYGEDVDWLKNLRAAGRGTIETRHGTHALGEPEIIDSEEALAAVSTRSRLMFGVFGVERYLKLKRLAEEDSAAVTRNIVRQELRISPAHF